jgi:hypothetical protein
MKQAILAVAILIASSGQAFAYIGPGLGLGAIATILGFVAAVLLAIIGVVWYPLKRLFRQRKASLETKRPDAIDESVTASHARTETES